MNEAQGVSANGALGILPPDPVVASGQNLVPETRLESTGTSPSAIQTSAMAAPPLPKLEMPLLGPTCVLYPLSAFSLSRKALKKEKDAMISARLIRMEKMYYEQGIRKSIEGVVLVHENGFPYILFLDLSGTYSKLPGGKLRVGESEVDGLKRKLNTKLAPTVPSSNSPEWMIGDLVSVWWRPNFETLFYPYVPPHITRPKECKKIFIVQLARPCNFEAPSNYELKAVPLFELYDNRSDYGPINASLPSCLSRFNFIFL